MCRASGSVECDGVNLRSGYVEEKKKEKKVVFTAINRATSEFSQKGGSSKSSQRAAPGATRAEAISHEIPSEH